ncbi:hypothetical protein [Leptospira kmetyi]|uniref:hypothetical protein n=1 Tax=Leptospira kmetyi TaxID=408139 RepID=UPI001082AD2B|nr:hypothetical protein [Leptospira kmetyi]TGK22698.1 hypothetical protein EHO62_00650 [Leptospira kmetyi]TGK27413.1 hypothetical protein EHO66_16040 [Leptospira kmetyi]
MKRIIFSFISLVLFTNCITATKIDDALYNRDMTRTYNRSKEQTFNATILAFKELKVGIEKQDKEKGIIVTEKAPFYEMVYLYGNQYAATGQQFTAYHKYYLQVSGDKNSATVKTVKYRLWNNNVEQTELNAHWTKENVWDPFFKEIQVKLDGY